MDFYFTSQTWICIDINREFITRPSPSLIKRGAKNLECLSCDLTAAIGRVNIGGNTNAARVIAELICNLVSTTIEG